MPPPPPGDGSGAGLGGRSTEVPEPPGTSDDGDIRGIFFSADISSIFMCIQGFISPELIEPYGQTFGESRRIGGPFKYRSSDNIGIMDVRDQALAEEVNAKLKRLTDQMKEFEHVCYTKVNAITLSDTSVPSPFVLMDENPDYNHGRIHTDGKDGGVERRIIICLSETNVDSTLKTKQDREERPPLFKCKSVDAVGDGTYLSGDQFHATPYTHEKPRWTLCVDFEWRFEGGEEGYHKELEYKRRFEADEKEAVRNVLGGDEVMIKYELKQRSKTENGSVRYAPYSPRNRT
ncbi:hypothetical protein CYMTET_47243 [Cymbomonas tetramitiformis]|uniref:Uncharacterized protein n=1 Tax=Cymbomonas tetramitiformis TaxID=36881 RepID=A0AAE0BUL3_9CHLO|nr:hypothetical protein CYMTET_47243 [Cymbomonas tetramitiformis]